MTVSCAEHFGVLRWLGDFVIEKHFLVQLFAWPDSRKLDLDIGACFQTGETNHIASQVHDFDRLAHVQHEQFAATSLCAGLQYELHCFGNRHEIAAHVGVRHLHRPAILDLPQERGNHASTASEYVAEAHRDEVTL